MLGDSASGKSIILKNIGYKLAQESDIYYIELKRYSTKEIEGFFELICNEGTHSVIIIDDAHLFAEECARLARKFRNSGNGHLIMGSRESLLFRYGPKDFNEFEDITMTRIESKSIAYDIVRLFLSRKHNMSKENIESQIEKFEGFKHDLWFLSWSLMAFSPDKNKIEMDDIYSKIINSITALRKNEKIINGEKIFFPISVFYRFEIPIEKRFLKELGIAQNEIEDLIMLGEIVEDKKVGMMSLHHSSIADLYYMTYNYAQGLGGDLRSHFGVDFQYNLFLKYIVSKPINLSKLFISLYYSNNSGVQLLKRLIHQKEIQNSIRDFLKDNSNLADIGMGLLPIAKLGTI